MTSEKTSKAKEATATGHVTNFIRNMIADDLARGVNEPRHWAGQPGVYSKQVQGPLDEARIRTRFPPEPNGYLHIGHAKSICLNFGLARDFGGRCHMRFDDTNPVKEDQEYVDSILDAVRWLGFDWQDAKEDNLYHASSYFHAMYEFAEHLIKTGYAYVDEQSAEEMRARRGSLTEPGQNSPFRDRSPEENLRRFHEMRAGAHPEGSMVLRAKINMASPNINLRDPAIYRIRFAEHHMTGNEWCIYPMYTFAHPIEDALENITHSICTLEFEDQRPFYDWVLERIVPVLRTPRFEEARAVIDEIRGAGIEAGKEFALACFKAADKLGDTFPERDMEGLFQRWEEDSENVLASLGQFFDLLLAHTENFTPLLQRALEVKRPNFFLLPHQYEFNRLNLTYVVMSKRKLIQLVEEKLVDGWDDPRMPTIVGLRRRGYTPEAMQLFAERIGVSKASGGWIDYAVLEACLREDLDAHAQRRVAVMRPLKLVIDNYPAGQTEDTEAPNHPQKPELGSRNIPFGRELWIEADDFAENPPAGYHRLALGPDGTPGKPVRLRYGYVIVPTGIEKNAAGEIVAVHADYLPDTKSGTPGASSVKTKAAIHWLPVSHAVPAEIRVYDRLFTEAQPDAGEGDFRTLLNPASKAVLASYVEAAAATAAPDDKFQFERNGYFVADRKDHRAEQPVFNLAVGLKDSWGK